MEDEEVMALVRSGHLERLAILFERHHLHLYHFFLRLSGRPGVSEDLVQEVFLRLLRYRAGYRPGSAFAPWMWEIARNAFRDQHRRQRPRAPMEDLPAALADPGEGADARLIRDQEDRQLQRALARLPPAKRELLLLSRSPDVAYADLAGMLACSVASVKVQVHRALKELRDHYFSLQGGQP